MGPTVEPNPAAWTNGERHRRHSVPGRCPYSEPCERCGAGRLAQQPLSLEAPPLLQVRWLSFLRAGASLEESRRISPWSGLRLLEGKVCLVC